MKDIKMGDVVKLVGGHQDGSVGVVTESPNILFNRDTFTVATEEYPYGEWYQADHLLKLSNEEEANEIRRKVNLAKCNNRDYIGYLPENKDPFEFFIEMAEIYPNYNKDHNIRNGFRVWVESSEGTIPHVHVSFNSKGLHIAYIKLGKADYLDGHKAKSKELNASERKALQRFFETEIEVLDVNGKPTKQTCWERAVNEWYAAITGDKIKMKAFKEAFDYDSDGKRIMPDYTQLRI